MSNHELPDYSKIEPRGIGPPAPVAAGSWWRSSWTVVLTGPPDALPHIAAPPDDLGELCIVLSLIGTADKSLRIDILHRNDVIGWNELAYVSIVLRAIDQTVGIASIDGVDDHPILKL